MSYFESTLLALGLLLASCGSQPVVRLPVVHIPPGKRAVSLHVEGRISVLPGDYVTDRLNNTSSVLENAAVATADPKLGVVAFTVSADVAQHVAKVADGSQFTLRRLKSD